MQIGGYNVKDLISEFTDKLKIKRHLYLEQGSFELYKDVYKLESNIEKEIIENKLVEIIDSNKINNEDLYLISSSGNSLGWVTVKNPIFIYSTFPEKVIVKNTDKTNIINDKLNLFDSLDENVIYNRRYFIQYLDSIYIGITNDDSLISFLPTSQLSNGEIFPRTFNFKDSRVRLFEDIYKEIDFIFLNNYATFECDKVLELPQGAIGSFRNGRTRYWFNIDDTTINLNELKKLERTPEYFLLEHLFYSKNYDKNNVENLNSSTIEEDIIKERFTDYRNRIEELVNENKKLKLQLEQIN